MENTLTFKLHNRLPLRVKASLPCLHAQSQEFRSGISIGALHAVPMVSAFVMAQMLPHCAQELSVSSFAAAGLVQFIAPAAVLAYCHDKLHKNTKRIISTGLVLAGITNGFILSMLVG